MKRLLILCSFLTILHAQELFKKLPIELWDIVLQDISVTNPLKQWALSLYKMQFNKKHIEKIAHEWLLITQKRLACIPDDGSNTINREQKNYIEQALNGYAAWHPENKNYFEQYSEHLLIEEAIHEHFKVQYDHFISGKDFGFDRAGHRIKRVPLNALVTDRQRLLFLIAFKHANCATIKAIDPDFPLEQVNGMGTMTTGFAPAPQWTAYFEKENRSGYHYQISGNVNIAVNKRPLYTGDIRAITHPSKKFKREEDAREFASIVFEALKPENLRRAMRENAERE